jgi:hypothetical protein
VNWYPELNEAPQEHKSQWSLMPSPGNALFSTCPAPAPFNQRCRGLIELRGNVYGVNGTAVFKLNPDGTFVHVWDVIDDGNPVSMVANGNGQIFIASGGKGYVIPPNGGGSSGIPVTTGFLGASIVTFQDGYIIGVIPNSNQFQISGTDATPLGDATQWDPANISVQAGQADYLASIISSREYLRLLGTRRSQIYENAAAAGLGGFPFQSYNETFVETGIAAPFSLADAGDSLIWIGNDQRGMRACWRDFAFQPQRISNFAVEQFWQQYPTVGDAIAFAFIWMGHLFYQVSFPSADKTWLYDATISQLFGRPVWHERSYSDFNGLPHARSEQFHCYAWGKHLVGSVGTDGNPGAIYQYSETAYTDTGTAIVAGAYVQRQNAIIRDRICPHIWSGNKRIVYNRIEFELARGVGLTGSPPVGINPQLLLRWSDDGGNTFGGEYPLPMGQIGQFEQRCYLNRAGYGRDRVFWVRQTDPVFAGLVAAELDLIVCAS